jgi:hypothetical protein
MPIASPHADVEIPDVPVTSFVFAKAAERATSPR